MRAEYNGGMSIPNNSQSFCVAPKMGILAENHPLTIVLARQHHSDIDAFEIVEVNDVIQVKIIGKRFELNDEQITAIGKLVI